MAEKHEELPTGSARKDSVLAALDVVPDRWAFLVLREAFFGVRRFSDFRRSLGIARNTLSDRLNRLVESGVLEKRRIAESNAWQEYHLTEMGLDLYPVTVALMRWGDRWVNSAGAPLLLFHQGCGGEVGLRVECSRCGVEVDARDVRYEPGPGGHGHDIP
ncbi:MAG: helix-turn-helix transcriptional regulator [Deltaproteobacteria bacterium]|nr:helix-turn-helix transcriptional regulator [Deltaproteobacteria bacterium]